MDAVDVAGVLEFDCIVLRDELLDSREAIQRVIAEKWAFAKEEVGKSRSRCSEEASDVGVQVEGEVVYLNVEEEEDQDVDVEGDETSSVTQPPGNIESRGVSSADRDITLAGARGVTESKETKKFYSTVRSEGAAECGRSLLPATSPPSTCSSCTRHFSSEADCTNHVCVVTSEMRRSPRRGFSGSMSTVDSDVRQVPKVAKEKRAESPEGEILSDECDGVPCPEDSAATLATRGSEVSSAHGDSRSGRIPAPSETAASILSEAAAGTHAYLWKSALGVCGICGKIFNNNSNLKRHALVHGSGIFLTCDVCGQFFPDRCSLWRHKEQHGGKSQSKMYKCNVCGKCVNSNTSLRKHRSQHVQPYVCDICGESFHRASGLQIHKYLHVR
ncbi:zinc finger protein 93-like [Schistocerca americana]|uniref:zinc finger protein 93-like n=1 Tax=Schistocerca americana TaxID=7009 RepID=UPI001F4F2C9B|nr:zinc finger protein 93-like [Schistocerca americana]